MPISNEVSKILDEFLPLQHSAPTPFPGYMIALQLKEQYPNHQHILLRDPQLPLVQYLTSQGVECRVSERLTTHKFQRKLTPELNPDLNIGVIDFAWMGAAFQLFKFRWPTARGSEATLSVLVFPALGETKEEKDKLGIDLITRAYRWNLDIREEIWCFSGGCWFKDSELYRAIQASDWDSLVLDQTFIDGLKRDTESFFSSKEIYHSLGITWKRGLLLLGAYLEFLDYHYTLTIRY